MRLTKTNFPRIRAFSVTTTAKKVLERDARRKAVLIYNNGTATVYLIDSERQTTSNGIPIVPGTAYDNDHFNCQGEYWIIGSGTDDIRIEEDIQNA